MLIQLARLDVAVVNKGIRPTCAVEPRGARIGKIVYNGYRAGNPPPTGPMTISTRRTVGPC